MYNVIYAQNNSAQVSLKKYLIIIGKCHTKSVDQVP